MEHDLSFTPDRLEMIDRIEETHFWFRGRRKHIEYLFERFFNEKVSSLIDAGCGTGFNLKFWSKYATQVSGIDQYADRSKYDYSDNTSIEVVIGDVTNLLVESESVDIVISLDVLEHVDDKKMISEIMRVLRPGGSFIASIPALPSLWSNRDIKAGHKRRYTKKSVKDLLSNSGCQIVYLNYFQFLLFPVVWIARRMSRFNTSVHEFEEIPGKVVNTLFGLLNKLELGLVRLGLSLPVGSTLIVYAKKIIR